ncbi:hypothetical protein [Acinetobacter soli]|uniref:hypothetical protein n=1 Tax=Acinetobacter soli TaxID=487316 RepID=UPI000DD0028F|nr:hypothetical protein [Acinetobacter soli]RSB57619.1 hypothetical protein EGK59_02450 [Acinetobacter soli]
MIDENRVIWNSIGANLLYKNLAFGKIILFKKWFKFLNKYLKIIALSCFLFFRIFDWCESKLRDANYKPASIGIDEAKRIFADKNEASPRNHYEQKGSLVFL